MRNVPISTDIDALLAHTDWVRGLAHSLVKWGDPGVDDVVQETWLRAMEHPPRQGVNLRAWLSIVVRNVVRQARRSEARRAQRERSRVGRGEAPDTAEVVERADAHRMLVNHLMDLDEPYRTAILLRYFENLPPRGVAKRVGCPVETVRAWLRRGLEKLRWRLDRAQGGDGKAWMLALVPLLKPAGTAVVSSGGLLLGTQVAAVGIALITVCAGILVVSSLQDTGGSDLAEIPPAVGQEEPATRKKSQDRTAPGNRIARSPGKDSTPARSLADLLQKNPLIKGSGTRVASKSGASAKPAVEKKQISTSHRSVVERLAILVRAWEGPGLVLDLKSLKKKAGTWDALVSYVEQLRLNGIHVLKMPKLWWDVYTHPKYCKFEGRPGKFTRTWTYNRMGRKLPVRYFLQVPRKYRPNAPFPLVLCLHPRHGPVRFDTNASQMFAPRNLERRAMLLAPELPKDPRARWSDRKFLFASLQLLGQEVIREYNVDRNLLFLDGHLDGAAEAWRMAGAFADLFAGVIIRGALPPEGTRFEDFRNTPFFLVGLPDKPLDKRDAIFLARNMRKGGVKVTVASAGMGDALGGVNVKLLRFLRTPRNPYPDRIDWTVKENYTRRCFFVCSTGEIEDEVLKKARDRKKPPRFVVEVDRTSNRLVIQTHRILGLKISLNDCILDLDRPVSILVNGKEAFRGQATRDLETLLEGFQNSGDWARIYPWNKTFKVPR